MTNDWLMAVKEQCSQMQEIVDVPGAPALIETTKQNALQKRAMEIALSKACGMLSNNPEAQSKLFDQLYSAGYQEALEQWEGERQ